MVTTVILVRHCRSMGNIEGRFQGRTDSAVSEIGEKQLELLSLRFRNQTIDAIYSSPLTRAYQTAEAINRFHGLPIHSCNDLMEIDVGDMENMRLSDIAEKFPVQAKHWNETPDLCEFPAGETMEEVFTRVSHALETIIRENLGKTVVLTTHGGVLCNLCAYINGKTVRGIREEEVFENTSVTVVTVHEDGTKEIVLRNDFSHLPAELQKKPNYVFEVKMGAAPV